MRHPCVFTVLICLISSALLFAGDIIAPGAQVKKIATGFDFTEGPAVDSHGNVYFTDQPHDRILKWHVDGVLTTFMQPCGRANGMYFDSKDNLWACADENNQLWRIDPQKNVTVVLKDFEGQLLNGPNDLWISPRGGTYFTDPYYKRPWWNRTQDKLAIQGVYYITPNHKKVTRIIDDLQQPNGIIGTPDGKKLYVSDIRAGKTYSYTIQKNGALTDKKLFCELGSDGMTIDDLGNVYLTGRGVTVFNPNGEQIEHITVDAPWTANVCFGGADRKTLFITASKGFYALAMTVTGITK